MAINRTGTNPQNDVKLPTIDIEPEIIFHMCSLWETGAIDSNGAVLDSEQLADKSTLNENLELMFEITTNQSARMISEFQAMDSDARCMIIKPGHCSTYTLPDSDG